MALKRQMADGTEYPCHKCGGDFKPGELKTQRPSSKPGMPGTFTVGGAAHVWVHEKCGPQKHKKHGRVKARKG